MVTLSRLTVVVVLGSAPIAVAGGPVRSDQVRLVPRGKIRTANVIAYRHGTGRIHWVTNGAVPRATEAAFDNLSAPVQDPNLGLNICPLSAVDPNTGGVDLLCKYPVSQDTAYYGALGNGDQDCPNRSDWGPYYPGVVNDPQDIIFDKYLMDPTVAGGDPNDTIELSGLRLQTDYDGADTGVMALVTVMAEANDTNGNGIFDVIDQVTTYTLWEPNTPAGLYTLTVFFDPNDALLANVRGRRSWDVLNERFDPADPTFTTEIGPTCSFGSMMVGGNPQGLYNWDPNCATPQDLVSVGTVDEPNIIYANATDSWQWFNDTQGDGLMCGFIPEPNCPLDSGFDGDPNSVSYLDILNTGRDEFWVYYFPGGNELDIAPDTAHTFYVTHAESCAGDLNGDGAANIADLGVLLAAFGQGPGGDLNGSGTTDVADFGILLSDFGCAPPP